MILLRCSNSFAISHPYRLLVSRLASAGNKRKRLTPEEQEIRQREDELFSKLADAPIVLDGFAQVLGEEAATKDARDESITDDDR